MPKLFIATASAALCCLISSQAAALNSLCPAPVTRTADMAEAPMPDNEQLHQAMLQAIDSASTRLDWVSARGNACGGYYQEPVNPNPQQYRDNDKADLLFSAEDVRQNTSGLIELSGNVELYQGARRLRCDAMRMDQAQQYSELSGNIQLREPGMLLMADKAVFDGIAQQSQFINATYLLHDQQARGHSQRITINGTDQLLINLQDTSFTLCPPDAEHWAFSAKKLEIDEEKGWGTLRSAVFKVADVPVMYIPWLNFPVDDRRKTGVLWPSVSGSGSSVDIALPVYFNLAPHYDLTYTPRILSNHGYLHNIEGRYKQRYSDWAIGGSYIHDDKRIDGVKTDRNPSLDSQRWLGFVQQQGRFNEYWTTSIDYQAVSDIHYFRDWGTTGLDVQKSLNIKREANVQFNSRDWFASAKLVDYQNLEQDPVTNQLMDEAYRQWPAIDVFYRNTLRSFRAEPLFQAQYSYFDHDRYMTGHRLYLEPGITVPLRWQALEIIPSARLKSVQFMLDNDNTVAQAHEPGSQYKGHHGEQIPTFAINSRLFFERREGDSVSILSPRLFYYYAHYQDQRDLPNFDTEAMAFSYQQLWRENRLSGFDRISDANQLSIALENSWQQQGRTVFDAGIGQILYFSNRKVSAHANDRQFLVIDGSETAAERRIKQQINREIDKTYFRSASDIAAQASWYPAQFHSIRSSLIVDPYRSRTSEAAIGYHYSDDQQRIFNLAYRYKYQPHVLDSNGNLYRQATDQLDGSFYLPVAAQWHIYLRSNVDITRTELIENIAGVKYEGCCWGVMLAYKRERKTFENNSRMLDTADAQYRNSWYIQFELKGLGGVTDTINRLLEESIQGFK